MTKERAYEIYTAIQHARFPWQEDVRKYMTYQEHDEVMDRWRSMPGYTCYADALLRLVKGE